jgi:methylphosphotriester-DNA--protein-cysteine methyltransferase
MIRHTDLGKKTFERSRRLKLLLDNYQIAFAGNRVLKIYGHLYCSSGKRMLIQNRVFFVSEAEAISMGYRPCGHCMQQAYKNWKTLNNAGNN